MHFPFSDNNENLFRAVNVASRLPLCIICDNEQDVIFTPCGHLITCMNCEGKLYCCPICQEPIENRIKILLNILTSAATEVVATAWSLPSCILCCYNERDTVFIPCGHLVTCSDCGEKLDCCPICRGIIQNKIKVYLS